jgi:hypothetical protein
MLGINALMIGVEDLVANLADAGVRIDGDGIPLVFEDGMDYVGHIKFDSDGHPYFLPHN